MFGVLPRVFAVALPLAEVAGVPRVTGPSSSVATLEGERLSYDMVLQGTHHVTQMVNVGELLHARAAHDRRCDVRVVGALRPARRHVPSRGVQRESENSWYGE